MNDGLFLVASLAADSLGETPEWLGSDEPPFQPMDPLDFLSSAEVVAVYDLYRTQYLRLDAKLSIRTPDALLEYNRWVIVVGLTAAREDVAGKAVEPYADGRHYTRDITNVGPKTKLLVGKPVLE